MLFNVSELVVALSGCMLQQCLLYQVPLGCANPTVPYLLHRWTRNDLKVLSTVLLLKQGVQSLEYLLDVILW